jgi:hypothetical protein
MSETAPPDAARDGDIEEVIAALNVFRERTVELRQDADTVAAKVNLLIFT